MISNKQSFLLTFFQFLADKEYIILRNWENLPFSYPGSDIDLYVSKKTFQIILLKLNEICKSTNYKIWKKTSKTFDIQHIAFIPLTKGRLEDIVRLDFILSLSWMGTEFFSFDFLYKNKSVFNEISVLKQPLLSSVTLINIILYNGKIKQKYINEYNSLSHEQQEYLFSIASTIFRNKQVSNNNLLFINNFENSIFSKLRNSFLFKNWYRIPVGLIKKLSVIISRAYSPPGKFIVLFGPDGTGKTTIADQLKLDFSSIFYLGVAHFHFFPKIFKTSFIKIYVNKFRKKQNLSHWEIKQQKPLMLLSIIRLIRLVIIFWVSYIFYIYPRILKGQLIVGERWSFDLVYDPGGKEIHLPLWLELLAFSLTPKPKIAFSLGGNSDIISSRKNDIPLSEIENQLNLINKYLANKHYIHQIDCALSIDQISEIISSKIIYG